MKYNIELTKDELDNVVVGLENLIIDYKEWLSGKGLNDAEIIAQILGSTEIMEIKSLVERLEEVR